MHFGKSGYADSGEYRPNLDSITLCIKRIVILLRTDQKKKESEVSLYYQALYQAWGRQHWWPAETRFEVIVGAYLTQNTAWTNVELALAQLRAARLLNVEGIR